MSILHSLRVEAAIPRRTFPTTPAQPERHEYAINRADGSLPSSLLLEQGDSSRTLEEILRAIGTRVLASAGARIHLGPDYIIKRPNTKDIRTYMAKAITPGTELVDDFEWLPFFDLPDELQHDLLLYPARRL